MSEAPAVAASQTTDDAFLGGALHILQPKNGYRAGLDSVLLAASVAAGDDAQILDVGAGVGTAGLALARRLVRVRVVLVERETQLAQLARRNIERNKLDDRVQLVEADVARPLRELAALSGSAESFDHVIANPPYHTEGRGTAAGDAIKAGANAMPDGDLERWARFMASMARPGGTATIIHRADALHAILDAFAGRFGGAIIVPIHPREGAPASRVLVRATKGSRAGLQLIAGLVLHNDDNSFRPDVEAILRRGMALNIPRGIP